MVSKTTTAGSVLRSWLAGVGVHSEYGEGGVVLVDGQPVGVEEDILGPSLEKSLEAFHRVTESLGLGKPDPIVRPQAAPGRSSDFDLAAFRHQDFRKSPNPSPETFAKFERVVGLCARRFYYRNSARLEALGHSLDDMKSLAMVWMCNFAHKYQISPEVENQKLLNAHLQQRFSNFLSLCSRRSRNITPDLGTIQASEIYDWSPGFHSDEPTGHKRISRSKAKKELHSFLDGLSPEARVEKLNELAHNVYIDPGARKLARKLLGKVEEDGTGPDPLGSLKG